MPCHYHWRMAQPSVTVRVTVGPQGRIVIPAELRKALDIHPGEQLVARAEEGRLVLQSRDAIIAELQALFRDAVPRGVSLVDELIAERREEARREDEE